MTEMIPFYRLYDNIEKRYLIYNFKIEKNKYNGYTVIYYALNCDHIAEFSAKGAVAFKEERYIVEECIKHKDDKNSQWLYAGDIVRFYDSHTWCGKIGVVVWHEGRTGWVYEMLSGNDKGKCIPINDDWRKAEIIGNIHETPELLG